MRNVVRIGAKRKRGHKDPPAETEGDRPKFDTRAELIQALIPIGLEAVNDLLQQAVVSLVGARYSRGDGHGDCARWGRQQGSVYLGDHKLNELEIATAQVMAILLVAASSASDEGGRYP